MKPALILLLLLAVITSCNSSKPFQGKEFEGIITYKLTYENYQDSSYKEKFGDTMRTYFSHGKLLQIYNSQIRGGLKSTLVTWPDKHAYLKINGSDSLLYYNITQSNPIKGVKSSLTTFETGDTTATFLGHTCKSIKTIFLHDAGDVHFLEYRTFVYAPGVLPMNGERFKDLEYMAFNRTIGESDAYYLYFEDTFEHSGTTKYTAIKIEPKQLDSTIFNFDHRKLKPFTLSPKEKTK